MQTKPEMHTEPDDNRRGFLKRSAALAVHLIVAGPRDLLAQGNRPDKLSAGRSAESAPTRFIEADGIRYAYRRFGRESGVPLVLLMHTRGTMDNWDPALLNGFAKDRPVVIFDNAGVGASGGTIPDNVDGMADHALTVIDGLGLRSIDLLGFSIGGFVAQVIALRRPGLLHRLILAGTGPGGGVQRRDPKIGQAVGGTQTDRESVLFLFFSPTRTSQAAGEAYWARIDTRQGGREKMVAGAGIAAQLAATQKWIQPGAGSYARLSKIRLPVLVASGNADIMDPTESAFLLAQGLPDAQFIVYPDSGHGFLFQYHQLFLEHATIFLDSGPT